MAAIISTPMESWIEMGVHGSIDGGVDEGMVVRG